MDVCDLDDIAFPDDALNGFCFRGKASYTKDSCTLVYSAANDKEHYFGDRKGEVTLTFIKSDLTAPFSFSNEASLNELPFR